MTAGLLAGYFMAGKGFGTIGDIIAGVMGALVGGALFEKTFIFAGSSLIGSLLGGCPRIAILSKIEASEKNYHRHIVDIPRIIF